MSNETSLLSLKHQLYEIAQKMRQYKDEFPVPEGVTRAESNLIFTIFTLRRRNTPISPGNLARCGHSTPGAISQILKTLEEKNYIERTRSEKDSRVVFIELTEKGEQIAEEIKREHEERIMGLLAFLGEEDVSEFARIMNRMLEFNESYIQEKRVSSNSFQGISSADKTTKGGNVCE